MRLNAVTLLMSSVLFYVFRKYRNAARVKQKLLKQREQNAGKKGFLQTILFDLHSDHSGLSYKVSSDCHLLSSSCNFVPEMKRKQ